MKPLLKFVALPLGVIAVVIAAAGAYVAATFDPNDYKPRIVQAVRERTQRNLRLEGDIKLTLLPDIGASLGKASLSERASEKEFAAVDDIRIAVKLLPLLSKQVVVDAVEVKNLRAHFVRYKDGRSNVDDLAGAGVVAAPAPAPTPEAKGDATPLRVEIGRIAVSNAAITYTDQRAGTRYTLSKLDLNTGAILGGKPSRIEASFALKSDKPALNLETALKTTLTFDLREQHYSLAKLDFRAKGLAAGVSDLVATVKGEIDARLASKEYLISGLAFAATGKKNGENFDAKFEIPKLAITRDKVTGGKIALTATLKAAQRKIAATFEIPGVGGTARAFKTEALTANINLEQDGGTLKARLTGPLAGSIDAERFELPKFVATVNVNNPALAKNALDATIDGSAQVDLARKSAGLAFSGSFDESKFNGKATLAKFSPPAYTFDIDIDRLDADRYLPKADAKPGQSAPRGTQAEVAPPLDASRLKDLNVRGSVKIGAFKFANVKTANFRADITTANGRLDVSPISANLYGGSLAGSFAVIGGTAPTVVLKQKLSGVAVGPLLKDAANFESIEGKGNFALDVSGQGATAPAIRKALNGTAAINLSQGAFKGVDILAAVRDAIPRLNALAGGKSQPQPTSGGDKTEFTELAGTFSIKNGVAHNSDLSGKAPLLKLAGDGAIDIGNETVDYGLRATVVLPPGTTVAGLASVNGVMVPVRFTGPFAAPKYKIDYDKMAAGVAKGALASKVEEIKSRLRDQLQERLKGLLGR